MNIKKLFLVNILPLFILHLFLFIFSKATHSADLKSLEFDLILLTPLILFIINYSIKVEEENVQFWWMHIIFIILGNAVGLFFYFLNTGITLKHGLPDNPADYESAGIATLIYYLTILQCIIGSIFSQILLFRKFNKR
ncbi:hypothetical protein [Rummeliibacillus stabekisii]|uniref:hypothetical protein n=1 Tax=Rummeliibacillus stabekisii TaxID=241244 RepID=UPI00370FD0A2